MPSSYAVCDVLHEVNTKMTAKIVMGIMNIFLIFVEFFIGVYFYGCKLKKS